jgi:hypothetical protein
MCVEINYRTSTSDLGCHTNQNVKLDDVPLSNFLRVIYTNVVERVNNLSGLKASGHLFCLASFPELKSQRA